MSARIADTLTTWGTVMLAGVAAGALAGGTALAQSISIPQTDDPYWADGQETLERMQNVQPNTNEAKNVILFVADGMGVSTVTAARIFEGQELGMLGEEHSLFFEEFPYLALVKTYNTDSQVADSAGTAAAMTTGVKTRRGVIGLNSSVPLGDCEASHGNEVTTIGELAEVAGKSTGFVVTARATHATPAAVYAHIADRNWEDDSALADVPGDCKDIARQLIEFPYGNGINIAMGGGRQHFLPDTVEDPEDPSRTGRRTDGRDLTQEWLDRHGDRGAYVWNQEQFDKLNPDEVDHVLGLFNASHMEYEADRHLDAGGEPSLSEMTSFAIDVLSKNENGFFLLVEAGRVDHAHHANNAYRALTDMVEFAKAIETALDKVDLDETLIIVTADHSHVFTIAGYPERGNPILGLAQADGKLELGEDGKPYTTLGYANGPGAQLEGPRLDLTEVDTTDPDFLQPALVPRSSETHGGEDVALYAIGPWAHLFSGVVEQSYIFHVMDHASGISEKALAAADEQEVDHASGISEGAGAAQ